MRKLVVILILALSVVGCSKSNGSTSSNDSHTQGLAALGH
jgi:uncharacterized protein YcfL